LKINEAYLPGGDLMITANARTTWLFSLLEWVEEVTAKWWVWNKSKELLFC